MFVKMDNLTTVVAVLRECLLLPRKLRRFYVNIRCNSTKLRILPTVHT